MSKKTDLLIKEFKEKNNVVILAHNYQLPDVQDVADFVGDSLELAKKATLTDAENIVFCGVDFMAESAKILNPDKNVVLPDPEARCPMAAMVDVESLEALKNDHPNAQVVAYINTTADVKAISDICCTSANGPQVVNSVETDEIIFVPDINLGMYVKRFVHDKKMVLWPGFCPTHHKITKEEILGLKKRYPRSEIMVHPECRPEVIDIADHVFSTQGMVNHVARTDAEEFIVGTERELCYRLKKENPDRVFHPVKTAVCPNMKKITIEKVLNSVRTLKPSIKLSEETMKKAWSPLKKMMEIGRGDMKK